MDSVLHQDETIGGSARQSTVTEAMYITTQLPSFAKSQPRLDGLRNSLRSDSPLPHIDFAGPGRSHARRRRGNASIPIEKVVPVPVWTVGDGRA